MIIVDNLLKLVTPFKSLTPLEKFLSSVAVYMLIIILWSYSGSKYIPAPLEIIKAFPRLITEKDLVRNFGSSLGFCFKAIAYSSVISLLLCYLSVLPLFESSCRLLRKLRFLPSAGLSFLFMKMTGNLEQGMFWMMIWGVTTWLADSMIGIALSISPEDKMYAKSLRLGRWQMMRELLIYGKAAELALSVIVNFAMAWMLLASIENIAKANGGIGVVLAESAKWFKYDEVYAEQILILVVGNVLDYLGYKIKDMFFPYAKVTETK